jgi:hypothetical protein
VNSVKICEFHSRIMYAYQRLSAPISYNNVGLSLLLSQFFLLQGCFRTDGCTMKVPRNFFSSGDFFCLWTVFIFLLRSLLTENCTRKPPTWATHLEQAWTRVSNIQAHDSSKLNPVFCVCSPRFGLGRLGCAVNGTAQAF